MIVDVAGAAAALQGADDILILTHRRPDGDTAGCAGALCRALRQIGKTAYILENPEITSVRRKALRQSMSYPPISRRKSCSRIRRNAIKAKLTLRSTITAQMRGLRTRT